VYNLQNVDFEKFIEIDVEKEERIEEACGFAIYWESQD
jgi:hypothetical protein